MDQKRFFTFFTISILIWYAWYLVLHPKLFPPVVRQPLPAAVAASPWDADAPADALLPQNTVLAGADQPDVAPCIGALGRLGRCRSGRQNNPANRCAMFCRTVGRGVGS